MKAGILLFRVVAVFSVVSIAALSVPTTSVAQVIRAPLNEVFSAYRMQILSDKASPLYRALFQQISLGVELPPEGFDDRTINVMGSTFVRGALPAMCNDEYAYFYNPYTDVFALFSIDPKVVDASKFHFERVIGAGVIAKAVGRQDTFVDGGKFDMPTFDLAARTAGRLDAMRTLCTSGSQAVLGAFSAPRDTTSARKTFMRYGGAIALSGQMSALEHNAMKQLLLALYDGHLDGLSNENFKTAIPTIQSLP